MLGKLLCCAMSKKPNKQTEQAICKSEERLRTIINQGHRRHCAGRPDRAYHLRNDHYCEITGYPREELPGKRWQHLTHPNDISQNMELLDKIVPATVFDS